MSTFTNLVIFRLIVSVVLFCCITPGLGLTRRYLWRLENTSHTRLCRNKTMLTINGQFPGPAIYARRGDLVIVDMYNNANQNVTIHWHGVKMPRYPWGDGPEYITQCPIAPGMKFRYRVVLSDEEGTLWWHAHSEWSRATVYGIMVILPLRNESYPFPKPRAEVPLLLGEWWHDDVEHVMESFLTNGGEPEDSVAFTMNGQPGDLYRCSKQDRFRLSVRYGQTYLIRMVNAVMNNIMFFSIANHSMTIVGTDGAYTKQFTTDLIAISPGQTIDFLITANQPVTHYYMASRVYAGSGFFQNTTTTGILQYIGKYTPPRAPPLPSLPGFMNVSASVGFTNRLRSLANQRYPIDVPLTITDSLFFTLSVNSRPCLVNNTCRGPENSRLMASVNNITMQMPRTSIIDAYYRNISNIFESDFPDRPPLEFNYTRMPFVPRALWRPENGTGVRFIDYNATVEIVFQGTNTVSGIDHPMHLHGYSFYVVGSGLGNFNNITDPLRYNLVDPPLMETIAVPVNGWTTIRFRANNPGVWFMHCHFERHVSWGMAMTFIVRDGIAPEEKMLPPPPDMPRC